MALKYLVGKLGVPNGFRLVEGEDDVYRWPLAGLGISAPVLILVSIRDLVFFAVGKIPNRPLCRKLVLAGAPRGLDKDGHPFGVFCNFNDRARVESGSLGQVDVLAVRNEKLIEKMPAFLYRLHELYLANTARIIARRIRDLKKLD